MILWLKIRAVWPNIDFDGSILQLAQSIASFAGHFTFHIFTDLSSDVVVINLCSIEQLMENITP